jgi:hypothetical protein
LQGQLAELFVRENRSSRQSITVIPATYLRVRVDVH